MQMGTRCPSGRRWPAAHSTSTEAPIISRPMVRTTAASSPGWTRRLNGKKVSTEIAADTVLLNLLRDLGCKSVKCGCETTNCGLCTVWIDGKSRLSCSVLAASIDGHEVTTLEGVEKEAAEFGSFLAQEGAEQCGFCSPGFIMNVLAMFRELKNPSIEEIKEYLAGNLCRCTGYMGQLRAIQKYMEVRNTAVNITVKKMGGEE